MHLQRTICVFGMIDDLLSIVLGSLNTADLMPHVDGSDL